MLNQKAEDLESLVDLPNAGFPCPPWAGNGNKKGTKDTRFRVFFEGIEWILYLAELRGLIGICLENVEGTMNNIGGRQAYYPRLLKILQDLLPMFRFRLDHLDAKDYRGPASRPRVLLRGLHVKFAPQGVPPPLPPMGTCDLKDNDIGDFPNTDISTMTVTQQRNLQDYNRFVRQEVRGGKIPIDSILVISVDRDKHCITVNHSPCLTCQHRYLFLMKASEVGLPARKRTLYRWVHPKEKLHWQGFPADKVYKDLGPLTGLKAAGNCYTVGMMFAGLMPTIASIARANVDLTQWPPTPAADAAGNFEVMKKKAKQVGIMNERPLLPHAFLKG